jgi:hypothetical protein
MVWWGAISKAFPTPLIGVRFITKTICDLSCSIETLFPFNHQAVVGTGSVTHADPIA